jgi:UDP-N-acetylmuramoyl-tripeptide--D-alanyl-D-alanine ligase
MAEEAARAGMQPSHITAIETSDAAVQLLLDHIGAGDVVLIKGSRGMRMDQIVSALGEKAS